LAVPYLVGVARGGVRGGDPRQLGVLAQRQGLTLVHFSPQRKHFMWAEGCTSGLFGRCLGGVGGNEGVFRVYFVSETVEVELKSGRV
jgi:nicotinamide mononucleotide (NMN) deamidase PncC